MNAVAQPAPAGAASMSPADPAGDAVRTAVVEAKTLAPGSVLASQAMIATVAADLVIPAEMFGFIAKAMGDATKGDPAAYRRQMERGRAALEPAGAASGPGVRAPAGMANPDPAATPQPLDTVLEQVSQVIRRQVVCSPHAIVAVTLWVGGTYGFKGGSIFPRLAIVSAVKRSGKSTLLGTVAALSSSPLKADNVTAAALFRIIEAHRPTMILDEGDTFLRQNEELRCVLNAGFEASGAVLRTVPNPDGSFNVVEFRCYAPVAIAAIGTIPETVLDRSIVVSLERAASRGAGSSRPLRHRTLALDRYRDDWAKPQWRM